MTMFASLAAEEMVHNELPMPTWAYGALALLFFALMLGVTWSFRGTAVKYMTPEELRAYADGTSPGTDEH